MFRISLFQKLKGFQGGNGPLLSHARRCNSFMVRMFSSPENLATSYGNTFTSRIPATRARDLYVTSRVNGQLMEMLEDLQRKKREKSRQDQLAGSFNIVQKNTDGNRF